jgi:hypothetical protein
VSARLSAELCPNIEDHTWCPDGYVQWHTWAEEMAKTHNQRKCDGCGRYVIWEPKSPAPQAQSVEAERGEG